MPWRLAVLLALSLVYLAPVLLMVMGSLKPDARVLVEAGDLRAVLPLGLTLENYGDVLRRTDFGRYLVNSLLITAAVVLAGLMVNSLAGYALARLRWRGRTGVLVLVLALLIIPFEAIAVPLFYQAAVLGWRDTYTVQIVPFVANAFAIYLFYSFFLDLPRELEEAAELDGAGRWRTFLFVIVPNARPAFATVAVLTFLVQWGAFLWPLMVTIGPRVRPLPVAIAQFQTLPPLAWGDILAFGVMMVAPVVAVFVLFQGWFVRGVAAAGLKQ
jgi:multiple sugar transport system permease protein